MYRIPFGAGVSLLLIGALILAGCQPIQPPAPMTPGPAQVVIDSAIAFQENGIEASLAYFAGDATYTIVGMPTGPEVHAGKEALRAWMNELGAQGFALEVEVLNAQGNIVTTRTQTWVDFTRQLGIAPLVATEVYVVEEGKIAAVTWVLTPESKTALLNALAALPPAPTVLVQGGPLKGANGLTVGPDGYLYVGSLGSNEIAVIDPATGEMVRHLTQAMGAAGADDVVFGPDGSLYWTELFAGNVGRMRPDGTITRQQVAPGVNPITFSGDGRLFVALDFLGDALYELDPELQAPPRLLSESLGFLNAFDFGPDGLLYGPIYTQGRVVRIDVDATPVQVETVVDNLVTPAAAKFDPAGRLYVADQGAGIVWRVDLTHGEKVQVVQLPPGLDNLAFAPDGRLFVSSNDLGDVWEILPNGVARTLCPGKLTGVMGLAALPLDAESGPAADAVYVSAVFALHSFAGNTGGALRDPWHTNTMSVAPAGDHLVLTSLFANLVSIFDPATGEVLAAYLDFAAPTNAVEFQGDLIVAELGTGSVVRMAGDDPTTRTVLANGLTLPMGLAATEQALWVGDQADGTIWQLIAEGEALAEPAAVATGLAAPSGMAVTPDGRLLVLETGTRRLLSLDPATGSLMTLAENVPVTEATMNLPPSLQGGAVGPSGAIYVAGNGANQLLRIGP